MHIIRTVSLRTGEDTVAHLLRTDAHGLLHLEADGSVLHQLDAVPPGSPLQVRGTLSGGTRVSVQHVVVTDNQALQEVQQESEGFGDLEANGTGVAVARLGAPATAALSSKIWIQKTANVVKEMPILFIIASICGSPPTTTRDVRAERDAHASVDPCWALSDVGLRAW